MKVVKLYGVGGMRIVDIETVTPRNNQALTRALYGGICGSDLRIYRKGMLVERLEETMGRESMGRICSAPAENGLNEGDLVVGDPQVPCGHCPMCSEGDGRRCTSLGFIGEVGLGCSAEYLASELEKLIVLPKDTDLKWVVLCKPLAMAIRACKEIMRADSKRVLVARAGLIGLLIACLLGMQYHVVQVTVAGLGGFRQSKAERTGADRTISDGFKAGRTFDCAMNAADVQGVLEGAVQVTHPGGSIFVSVIYGTLPVVDVDYPVSNEQKLCGNNAYSFSDLQEAARLTGGKALILNWLVTRVLPADQADRAFRLLTAAAKTDLEILLGFQI